MSQRKRRSRPPHPSGLEPPTHRTPTSESYDLSAACACRRVSQLRTRRIIFSGNVSLIHSGHRVRSSCRRPRRRGVRLPRQDSDPLPAVHKKASHEGHGRVASGNGGKPPAQLHHSGEAGPPWRSWEAPWRPGHGWSIRALSRHGARHTSARATCRRHWLWTVATRQRRQPSVLFVSFPKLVAPSWRNVKS